MNERLVWWEDTNKIDFVFRKGIVSKIGLSILSNSKMLKKESGGPSFIPFSENLESNENGEVFLKYSPAEGTKIFLYNGENGEIIKDYSLDKNKILVDKKFLSITVDYIFQYNNRASILEVGNRLFNGYVKLDAKIKVKDDYDGKEKTGILEIPKLKLMSNLSLKLGKDAAPQTFNFSMSGFPEGERGKKHVCKIIFLEDEIDSDF